ncbi:PASTA domain-containing protein [Lentzea xinjiangensis]
MPDLTGLTQREAETKLKALGWNGNLNVEEQQVTNPQQKDKVLTQNPAKGQQITKGSTVTITVAKFGIITS